MKSIRILFTTLLLMALSCATEASAQDVYVYSKIGKFYVRKNQKDKAVNVQTRLGRTDIMVVPAKGKLVLFDPDNRKEIEIRTSYDGVSALDKLINDNETTTARRITDMYFKFLCHQMIEAGKEEGNENVPTAVVRAWNIDPDEVVEEPADDEKYLDD